MSRGRRETYNRSPRSIRSGRSLRSTLSLNVGDAFKLLVGSFLTHHDVTAASLCEVGTGTEDVLMIFVGLFGVRRELKVLDFQL